LVFQFRQPPLRGARRFWQFQQFQELLPVAPLEHVCPGDLGFPIVDALLPGLEFGRVGIGINAPRQKLEVHGGLIVQSGVVANNAYSRDFLAGMPAGTLFSAPWDKFIYFYFRTHDGRVLHPERIWSDKATDIAVLKVSASDLAVYEHALG
jgi:hypothetical protein